MIVRMTKYDFVLFARQKEDFLERLQELGLVDITSRDWNPGDRERELLLTIEKQKAAIARLRTMANRDDITGATPYPTGEQAWQAYLAASTEEDRLTAQIAQDRKEADELAVWGDFDASKIEKLRSQDIVLRFFHAFTKDFNNQSGLWSEQYTIVPINETGGVTYFVVIAAPGQEVTINAQEVKAPTATAAQKSGEADRLEKEREGLAPALARAAASVDLIEQHSLRLQEELRLAEAADSAEEAADGQLVVMEGWATAETECRVDGMLSHYPNVVYVKSDPTPEDEPPVLLKNNRFNRMFEVIGSFYSLPRYGTMDLTPFFGPFYVLFFGLCLADAGYGLLFMLAGLYLLKKGKPNMKNIGRLVTLLGGATMVCGVFMGSFFGMKFAEWPAFASFKKYILSEDSLFVMALGIGLFQILFGMSLKAYTNAQRFGFRYALPTLGWMLVVISSLGALLLGQNEQYEAYGLFSTWNVIAICVGMFFVLFMNSPGKNPLVNFGAGLWNTYNNLTGIIGDTLSYLRLFAIGLAGGILANVFNQLAVGFAPEVPVVKQLVIVVILLVGHGLTFFMSVLSAFVHPLRLTFVEFYNNAGFEATARAFDPLRKAEKE